ncbi:MAG: hypothetical protein CME61_01710 [Halobacteriovoraceae bacterium]|nr:hypothetical protein [Halobacteriovoraceae bacterium]
MTDVNFPLLEYKKLNNYNNGCIHGETFREEIRELADIRRELLFFKNPRIKSSVKELALQQFLISQDFSPEITKELEGISNGSGVSLENIVLLNNYTDFRDISLPDEGCSTIQYVGEKETIAGQTWDMHKSAKQYVCLINIEQTGEIPAQVLFSLVGCVGMMGYNAHNLMVGVNNLNTTNANASLIWPILIREALKSKNYPDLKKMVKEAPVTSGHNYLVSSPSEGSHLEVTPTSSEEVSRIDKDCKYIFHTNHCIGLETKKQEVPKSINSTTQERYNILEAYKDKSLDFSSGLRILKGHENYPKSICSHFEANTQDPSTTCGGALGSFQENIFHFWRGCEKYDENYIEYNFKLSEDKESFIRV